MTISLCASSVRSQEPPATTEKPAEKPAAAKPSGLDIQYLENEDGELVPVPIGMKYEDFLRLDLIDRGLRQPEQLAEFSISELKIKGEASDRNVAELAVELTIRVNPADKTVTVPLGFPESVPVADAEYDGPGIHLLKYDPATKQYVCRIRATEADSIHKVSLKLLRRLEQNGDESSLSLVLPAAPLSSIELVVPLLDPQAKVSGSGLLESNENLEKTPGDQDRSRLTIVGARGEQRITWSAKSSPMQSTTARTPFRAEGIITVRIDSPESLTSTANFTIRSFGQPLEQLRIQLPAGAELIPDDDNQEYTTKLADSDPGSPIDTAIIEFAAPMAAEFNVRLDVRQNNPSDADAISLGGFFIENALRHSGYLVLAAEGDWLIRWDNNQLQNLRLVGGLPDETVGENVRATFAYDRQPNTLQAKIVRNTTRIRSNPTYVFRVSNDRVQLSARYDVDIRGAITPNVSFNFTGWEVDDVRGPSSILDNEVDFDNVSPLVVPLDRNYDTEMNMEVVAIKPIRPDGQSLTLNLPPMRNATSTSPLIVVIKDENIALTSVTDQIGRLDYHRVPSDLALTAEERASAQCYRLRDWQNGLPLRYEYVLKPRSVETDMLTRVDLTSGSPVMAEQQIVLDIANEPLTEVRFWLPADIEQFKVTFDNTPLDVARDNSDSLITDTVSGYWYSAPLRTPRLGSVNLTITFPVEFNLPVDDASSQCSFQMARPDANEVTSNQIVFVTPPETELRSKNEQWIQLNSGGRDSTTSLVTLQAEDFAGQVDIELSTTPRQNTSMIVERAMLQTWFSPNERRDRLVAVFHGNEETVTLRLPTANREAIVDVRVNGERQQDWTIVNEELRISCSPPSETARVSETVVSDTRQTNQLEVVYGLDRVTPSGRLNIEFPQILDARWVDNMVWHLVLPPSETLVDSPQDMVCIGWDWPFMRTSENASQTTLETWLGAIEREKPTRYHNEYAFQLFRWPEQLAVKTIHNGTLVMLLGIPLLLLAMGASHYRRLRHPAIGLLLAFGLGLAGLRWPLPVLQLAPYLLFIGLVCGCVPLMRRLTRAAKAPAPKPLTDSSFVRQLGDENITATVSYQPEDSTPTVTRSDSSITRGLE